MSEHARNKLAVADLLDRLADSEGGEIEATLASACHADAVWEVFHPFNRLEGLGAVAESFWAPLKTAFPDYEQRVNLIIGGDYEDRAWVSTLGHIQGTFSAPWLGIPPTHGLVFLRFGTNLRFRDGRIDRAYLMIDVIDLMRQAGFYPLRRMPGSAEPWPGPPAGAGSAVNGWDGAQGAETLRIVREMQMGLGKAEDFAKGVQARHSAHWHRNMNWYGPAGIGSSRGERGFLDFHGALFMAAFPDRGGVARAPEGPEDRPGHYIRAGDGRFAVTGGWPSIFATHLGGGWLGVPPSGRKVEMRVADWYRIDGDDKIIDNWVMMDTLHILHQAGLDVLDDLRHFADPKLGRWPR